MRSLLLVIPGHLGKDLGATATLDSDGVGSQLFFNELGMQQERWINLQQSIGFCLAWSLSPLRDKADVRLVVPDNSELKIYTGGMIKILDAKREVFTLKDRVDLANSMDADVIEIHNNSAPFKASGFETLCFSRENRFGETTESYQICQDIHESVVSNMRVKDRGIKPIYDYRSSKYIEREIYLLKNTKGNAIITEAGFMSSKDDLSLIDVDLDGYNEQIGACIWLGYQKWLTKRLGENNA